MTCELLIRDVENQAKKINIKDYLFNIVSGHVYSYTKNFKETLKELQETLEKNTNDLGSLKGSGKKDLEKIYFKLKKNNTLFDKLNDLYHSSNYFQDEELKDIFRSITRNLHKIENLSYKHLNRDIQVDSTPKYIKKGLTNFSQKNIAKRLNPEN